MEEQEQPRIKHVDEGSQLERELSVPCSEKDILSKIEALEKEGDWFSAASLAREHGPEYSERALENYRKAAETYRKLVVSKDSLLGENVLYPKKHVVKIGDYTVRINCRIIDIGTFSLVPIGHIKIKGPKFKINTFCPWLNNEKKSVIALVEKEIIKRYGREVNTEFLTEMLSEALKPYQKRV